MEALILVNNNTLKVFDVNDAVIAAVIISNYQTIFRCCCHKH